MAKPSGPNAAFQYEMISLTHPGRVREHNEDAVAFDALAQVAVLADGMAAVLMASGRIQKVIVGADRIAANGDAANKIGTYSAAVLARAHDIPFYVAAPRSTVDLTLASGAEIPIEMRAPDEMRFFQGVPSAPAGVDAFNPAFDVTPARLITGIVTEAGALSPPYEVSLAAAMQKSV